jgi:hypothetical protein
MFCKSLPPSHLAKSHVFEISKMTTHDTHAPAIIDEF